MMGIEGTCWDEHWVLYGNQFDNKFHNKKKRKWQATIFLSCEVQDIVAC